ncbi:hypothetical protein M7I_7702 [Glarea lozoyensis 74030]|uniref:Fungal N-terminal domain-containing protein n=1 Tax=Glarea lozoyensis (strain ATCC 74030 / MF5533) TaxID=1104152 RepID=H0EY07_GLAL7|nr:hypothetical protein M7I_7702 [Glarea lozoyensis 74030]
MDPVGSAQICVSLINQIYTFISEVRGADASIVTLRTEIERASRTLRGISTTWNKHRKIIQAQVKAGSGAWASVDVVLKETKGTLDEVRNLVKALSTNSVGSLELRERWRRPALAIRLRLEGGEIAEFRRRLEGHNNDVVALLSAVEFDIQITQMAQQMARDEREKKSEKKKELDNKKLIAEVASKAAKNATEQLVKRLKEEEAEAARKANRRAEKKAREDAGKNENSSESLGQNGDKKSKSNTPQRLIVRLGVVY